MSDGRTVVGSGRARWRRRACLGLARIRWDSPRRARVNRDDLRENLFGLPRLDHEGETAVTVAQRSCVESLLRSGRDVVVDDTNLRSRTCLTDEFVRLNDAFGWTLPDVRWATINAMKSAFLPFDERLAMINDVIKPGFAALGAD